jgi:hypothetical protein
MSGLVPDVVRNAVDLRSAYENAETFGLVAVVMVLGLLVLAEGLRVAGHDGGRVRAINAVAAPLLLAVLVMIAARLAALLP